MLLLLILAVFWFLWAKLDLIVYEDEVDTAPYVNPEIDFATESLDESDMILTEQDMEGLEQAETLPQIPESEIWGEEAVLNILLLGTDEHSVEFSPYSRSDSMILVSINREKNTVKLVSLQRGMGVQVLEGQYQGQYDWLTHMFRYGGADLVRKTVETYFRVDVDYYVRVNLNSVVQVVDIVGGVDVEMTKAEVDLFNGRYKEAGDLKAGTNRLCGSLAINYARLREIDSDFRRVERQRKIILAIVDRLKGSDLIELNAIADQVLPLIQTNLSKGQIAELILYAPNFLNASFEQMTLPASGTYGGMTGMGGRNLYAVDFETNSEILLDFLYGEDRGT